MSQVSLHGKLKYDVEYKTPADKVYEFWSCNFKDIPKACSKIIHSIELVQDGKTGTCEEIVEAMDCKKKYMSLKVIGGNLLDHYRSIKFILEQVTPKGDGASTVCWTMEYEKLNENVPDPIELRDAGVNTNKAIAAYLSQA
ncbi:hypothetical protein SLA2020_499560 [Shorea laevis]